MTVVLAAILFSGFFGQASPAPPPEKTTLCEIFKEPAKFAGKRIEVRAAISSGVDDLPAGVEDDRCGAELKFLTPDDQHFAQLMKSKAFQKLVKDVKKSPFVVATVTGRFERVEAMGKADTGLALESVAGVVMKPVPKVRRH